MKADTFDDLRTCPWRTLTDPFVAEVKRTYDLVQLGFKSGDETPRAILDGVRHYHRTREHLRALQLERDIAERKRNSRK